VNTLRPARFIGWPHSLQSWHKIIGPLAERYEVLALDLPGMGDSDRPSNGYDARTVASQRHQAVAALGLERFFLVTHDIGTWVAYPFAHEYGPSVGKLVIDGRGDPGPLRAAWCHDCGFRALPFDARDHAAEPGVRRTRQALRERDRRDHGRQQALHSRGEAGGGAGEGGGVFGGVGGGAAPDARRSACHTIVNFRCA
jgi:pimeloyl-ACP methyl ester carboxylesterase